MFEIHYEDPNRLEKYNETFLRDGLRYELSDMVAHINGLEKMNFKLSAEESIAMAEIMEKFISTER